MVPPGIEPGTVNIPLCTLQGSYPVTQLFFKNESSYYHNSIIRHLAFLSLHGAVR